VNKSSVKEILIHIKTQWQIISKRDTDTHKNPVASKKKSTKTSTVKNDITEN
jgi:hypothetical protein